MASLQKEIFDLKKEREDNKRTLLEISSWEYEKTRVEGKLKQMEGEVQEAKS